MAIGSFDARHRQVPMSDINVVPLVDVMLVLLVIFIITAPLLTRAIRVDLPKANGTPNIMRPGQIEFGIRATGELFWNGEPVTADALASRFAAAAKRHPQPELHIRADRLARYESLAQVLSLAAQAGLTRIGFVTEPAGKENPASHD
jgi:biopolymer transport protein ExbD